MCHGAASDEIWEELFALYARTDRGSSARALFEPLSTCRVKWGRTRTRHGCVGRLNLALTRLHGESFVFRSVCEKVCVGSNYVLLRVNGHRQLTRAPTRTIETKNYFFSLLFNCRSWYLLIGRTCGGAFASLSQWLHKPVTYNDSKSRHN